MNNINECTIESSIYVVNILWCVCVNTLVKSMKTSLLWTFFSNLKKIKEYHLNLYISFILMGH